MTLTTLVLALLGLMAQDPAKQDPPKKEEPKAQKSPLTDAGEILILGDKQDLEHIPGSGEVLDVEELRGSRPRDIHEVVRKIPGVHARDEEGFGLRPNYGVRGLLPTRSAKVLLLEDGVPITIGPYGDNTTYYHPPVERFERLEVLKGAGQILYGPNTIGAVFNYITPAPPRKPAGVVTLAAGSPGYLEFGGSFGMGNDQGGFVVDLLHKEGDGRADDIHLRVDDIVMKTTVNVGRRSSVMLKLNYLKEDSQVTYAGLTQSEYEADPRQNPFDEDEMLLTRIGGHFAFKHGLSDQVDLLVNLYGYTVQRDWWRQWHNGNNGNAVPATGTATIPNDQASGRVREYYVYGLEPRMQVRFAALGIEHESDLGVRAHYEIQDRLLIDGPAIPGGREARTGTISEDNERYVDAYSAFLQNRFLLSDQWTLTGGVRVEHVRYERVNNLANGGLGVEGNDQLTEVIPGAGINYLPVPELTLFAGVHRGFAPPRTEDAISNGGVPVDLDPEESLNIELGARWNPQTWLTVHGTFFNMDFENQLVTASVASGTGTALTNGGETSHQGLEALVAWDFLGMRGSDHRLELNVAFTWLWTAEFEGTRFSNVTGAALLPGEPALESTSGNRLPYAPERTLTLGMTYAHPIGLELRVETVYVSEQFSDDRETDEPTPNGRRGILDDYFIWNTGARFTVEDWGTTFFVTVKNAADEEYIVDRTRGIYAGMERSVIAGATWRF